MKNFIYVFTIIFVIWAVIGLVAWRASRKAAPLRKEYYRFLFGAYAQTVLLCGLMFLFQFPPVYSRNFRKAESLEEVNRILENQNKFSLDVEEYLKNNREVLSLFLISSVFSIFAIHRFAKKIVELSEVSEEAQERTKPVLGLNDENSNNY